MQGNFYKGRAWQISYCRYKTNISQLVKKRAEAKDIDLDLLAKQAEHLLSQFLPLVKEDLPEDRAVAYFNENIKNLIDNEIVKFDKVINPSKPLTL